jgi:hypothetical protein
LEQGKEGEAQEDRRGKDQVRDALSAHRGKRRWRGGSLLHSIQGPALPLPVPRALRGVTDGLSEDLRCLELA